MGNQVCTFVLFRAENTFFNIKSLTFDIMSVSSSGTISYSEVTAFMKKELSTTNIYKLLTTSSNHTISLSENNLIYARDKHMEKFEPT